MNSPSILHSLKGSFETVLLFHSVRSSSSDVLWP